jgi:outer membrane protein assembly factor BamB
MTKRILVVLGLLTSAAVSARVCPADWPQWGGSPARNNTPDGKNIPVQWNVGKFDYKTGRWLGESAKNILWVARLGSRSYGSPVVSGGKVFCATNNGAGYLRRYPAEVDLGCLLCFRQSDGRFGWQLSREKLPAGRFVDYPEQGICCSPLVEGDRLWLVTNRGEVACLDTNGFYDGRNDGPYTSEPSTARDEADVIWYFDMMRELGVVQRYMASCSVTAAGELLLVCTSNGRDDAAKEMPAPEAPSFIALDKHSGKLVWADNSPGRNVQHGQWGSPAFAVLGGVPQAIFPGGDGWLYSFLATPPENAKPESSSAKLQERVAGVERSEPPAGPISGGSPALDPGHPAQAPKPKLLWKFDCNPKDSLWKAGGQGNRNHLIATPVVCDGLVYIATGQDPEYGEGPGDLWCIDPTKRGDVSPELVFDKQGNPVPPRRTQALDKKAGEQLQPNPNSAAVWHYAGHDANGDGKLDFEETMHRTLSMAAVKDNLLVIADLAGLVHCLDAKTGKLHWTHDMLAGVWGSPLVVEGKIYLGDEDGDLAVFALSAQKKLLAENTMGSSVYSTPVVADNTLYISTREHLIAIGVPQP